MTVHDDLTGRRVLERYELLRRVGAGGMGTVYQAHDHRLDQVVALKQVGFGRQPDVDGTRRRTLREARLAAQLRGDRRVVSIYDVQEVDGDVWLVLEYLPSRSLAEVVANGTALPAAEVARIGAAVAGALAAAHERGIVHRDVKPGNVLIADGSGEVKLTDFGISRALGEQPLTAADVVSGTPAYMAREVARGEQETPASDVFSLGSTLYRAVEGRAPFGDDGHPLRTLHRVAHDPLDPPRSAGAFTPLLMWLLEFEPAARPDARDAQRLLDDHARGRILGPFSGAARSHGSGPPPAGPVSFPQVSFPPPSQPPPSFPPSAPSASTPGRSRRLRRTGIVAVVAVLLAAAAAGIVVADPFGTFRPADPTVLPANVPTLALTGNPRDADPCALLDVSVMERFGGPVRLGPGRNTGACRVTTVRSGQVPVITETHYSNARSEAADGPPQNLGGLSVIRLGVTDQGCSSVLRFADGTQVGLTSSALTGADGSVPELCTINETALAVAVNRLAANGVRYDPGWRGPAVLLGRRTACEVPGDALSRVTGLETGVRIGYPNGAVCFVGAAPGPSVSITLGIEPSGLLGGYGTAVQVDGVPAYRDDTLTASDPGARSCRITVGLQSPATGAFAEYVGVVLTGRAPVDELCRQAGLVAVAAERAARG